MDCSSPARDRAPAAFQVAHVPQVRHDIQAQHDAMQAPASAIMLESKEGGHQDTPRFSPLAFHDSALPPPSTRACSPSPTAYSFGPTPRSSISSLQSPPSASHQSIGHSRDSSWDSGVALSLGVLRTQSPLKTRPGSPYSIRPTSPYGNFRPQSPRFRPQSPLSKPRSQTPWNAPRPQTPSAPSRASNRPLRQMAPGEWALQQGFHLSQNPETYLSSGYNQEQHQGIQTYDGQNEDTSIRFHGMAAVAGGSALSQRSSALASYAAAPEAQDGYATSVHLTPSNQGHDVDSLSSTPTGSPNTQNPSPSPAASQDDEMTIRSEMDESSPASNSSDDVPPGQATRVLRNILEEEFDVRLGISEPPDEMVDSVSACLRRISLSVQQHHSLGFLVPLHSATLSSDSPGAGNSATTVIRTGKPSGAPRKRGASDIGGEDEDEVQDDDPDEDGGGACVGPGEPGNRKKTKGEQYPCPFRKRNPLRFNFREWEYCAKAPFKTITELKKHILKYHSQHQLAYRCLRCHEAFPRREDHDAHLMQDPDKMCTTRDRNTVLNTPGDEMISADVGDRLRSRAEHFGWRSLWQVLFPNDKPEDIPRPVFEPAVELHEVSREYHAGLPEFQDRLSTALDALLPKLPTTGLGRDTPSTHHILRSNLENILKEFMDGVFHKAQAQASNASVNLAVRRPPVPSSDAPSPQPRANTRTPSFVGTRPSSTASTTASSAPRAILPCLSHSARRNGNGWSPSGSSSASPDSSVRNSSAYLNSVASRSHRGSVVDAGSSQGSPQPGPPVYPVSMPPAFAQPAAHIPPATPQHYSTIPPPENTNPAMNLTDPAIARVRGQMQKMPQPANHRDSGVDVGTHGEGFMGTIFDLQMGWSSGDYSDLDATSYTQLNGIVGNEAAAARESQLQGLEADRQFGPDGRHIDAVLLANYDWITNRDGQHGMDIAGGFLGMGHSHGESAS